MLDWRYSSTPDLNSTHAKLHRIKHLSSNHSSNSSSEEEKYDSPDSLKARRGRRFSLSLCKKSLNGSNDNCHSPSYSPKTSSKAPSLLKKFVYFAESGQLSKSNSKSDLSGDPKSSIKKSFSLESNGYVSPKLFNVRRTQSAGKTTSPIEKTVIYNRMMQCILMDDCKALKALLKRRVIDIDCAGRPTSLLHEASFRGCVKCMGAIVKTGCQIDLVDDAGSTPLHASVLANQLDAVKYLLESNASVNVVNKEGWSPLHLAVVADNLEIVHELYCGGADPLLNNYENMSPFQFSISYKKSLILDYFLQLPCFLVDT